MLTWDEVWGQYFLGQHLKVVCLWMCLKEDRSIESEGKQGTTKVEKCRSDLI